MPSTRVDIPAGAYTQILAATTTGYAVVGGSESIAFVQASAQPPITETNASVANPGDVIQGASEPIWARPQGTLRGATATAFDG